MDPCLTYTLQAGIRHTYFLCTALIPTEAQGTEKKKTKTKCLGIFSKRQVSLSNAVWKMF